MPAPGAHGKSPRDEDEHDTQSLRGGKEQGHFLPCEVGQREVRNSPGMLTSNAFYLFHFSDKDSGRGGVIPGFHKDASL